MEYYKSDSSTHWYVVPNVEGESYFIKGLDPKTSVQVMVRAQNKYGLSPPSPLSKPMDTLAKFEEFAESQQSTNFDKSRNESEAAAKARHELTQKRALRLTSVTPVASRRVRLDWEVSK